MKVKMVMAACLVFILGIVAGNGFGAESIKQRMINRLPTIIKLKESGIVGENNSGYLEFVGSRKENADVVEAENRDRKAVYEAIAKKQGTTVEVVGKHRAVQIAEIAKPGEWLQDANGKWYQKP